MKCDICEREGFKYESWLCLEHGCKVGDFIDGLRPQVSVLKFKTSGDYRIEDHAGTVTIPVRFAEALYDYIKSERGEND